MKNIIGISGKIASGKDEVARIINEVTENAYRVRRFADNLKKVTELLTGIPASDLNRQEVKEKYLHSYGMSVRAFLQKLGTEAMRDNLHKNIWVKSLFVDYKDHDKWIIPDVRFENEYNEIKDLGGVVIRINRLTGVKNEHISETSLDGFDFDYTINNNGTIEDLKVSVLTMLCKTRII